MISLFKQSEARVRAVEVEPSVAPRPALPNYKLVPAEVHPHTKPYLDEYAEIAATVGVMPPDLGIESMKALLARLDYPIFSLQEVIAYMDAKAQKESKFKWGWQWRPLRAKDDLPGMRFGQAAERGRNQYGQSTDEFLKAASDYFVGSSNGESSFNGQMHRWENPPSSRPYDRSVPLHALKRVASIEKEHKGPAAFFVSDYAPEPTIVQYPDPFLMVVIPNLNLARGEGRFVIDFWDEPGFGIEQMLKP